VNIFIVDADLENIYIRKAVVMGYKQKHICWTKIN